MDTLERVGGRPGLEAILSDFYDRVFADPMIGYLFKGKSRERLVELEVQFTARALGAMTDYEGRGMRAAHATLRITGGQFDRRLQILRETLRDHQVDGEVQAAWLSHGRALRRAVVAGPCDETVTGTHLDIGALEQARSAAQRRTP
jgi:hemoglobin